VVCKPGAAFMRRHAGLIIGGNRGGFANDIRVYVRCMRCKAFLRPPHGSLTIDLSHYLSRTHASDRHHSRIPSRKAFVLRQLHHYFAQA
jgi:hypothetical protein